MSWESFYVVGFDLGPLLQGQMRIAKHKNAHNSLIIGPTALGWLITRLLLVLDVWDGIPTYRKSCAGNLLVWSDLTLGPSFKVNQHVGNHWLGTFWCGRI